MATKEQQGIRDSTKEFWLDAPRYDQSTFRGRLRHFLNVVDPRSLLASGKKLDDAIALLEDYENGGARDVSVEELWQAKKLKDALVHPDTGEKIPLPFCMAGFVPFGTPIVVGLLLPNLSYGGTMFFQWLNASHNSMINYYNRNASSPTSTSTFVKSYAAAAGTAMGVAVALTALIRRSSGLSPALKTAIQRFVPFPAVALSNVANVTLMRQQELISGITVQDDTGKTIGVSQAAAKKAIFDTAITRVVLSAPVLMIPPIIISAIEKTPLWRMKKLRLPIQAAVCTASFGGALPVAISVFPQQGTMPIAELEDELVQECKPGTTEVYYNKGL